MTPQTIKQLEQKYPFNMTKDEIIKEFQITKAKYKKWVGDRKFLTVDKIKMLIGDKI